MPIIEVVTVGKKPISQVWKIISDLENEPHYWKGTKRVLSVRREGDHFLREAIIAFRDSRVREKITLEGSSRVVVEFLEGPMSGTKTIGIEEADGGTKLTTVWDVSLRGALRLFSSLITGHVRQGTEAAHERILGVSPLVE